MIVLRKAFAHVLAMFLDLDGDGKFLWHHFHDRSLLFGQGSSSSVCGTTQGLEEWSMDGGAKHDPTINGAIESIANRNVAVILHKKRLLILPSMYHSR